MEDSKVRETDKQHPIHINGILVPDCIDYGYLQHCLDV